MLGLISRFDTAKLEKNSLTISLKKRALLIKTNKWDKVFKNETSKICGRRPLKNLKGYGLLKQTLPFKFFKRCFSQILLGPFLNTLS